MIPAKNGPTALIDKGGYFSRIRTAVLKISRDEHEIRSKSAKVRCYRFKRRKISVYVR